MGTMLQEGIGACRRVREVEGGADTTQAVECHLLLSGDDVSSAKGTTLRGLPNMEEKAGMSSVCCICSPKLRTRKEGVWQLYRSTSWLSTVSAQTGTSFPVIFFLPPELNNVFRFFETGVCCPFSPHCRAVWWYFLLLPGWWLSWPSLTPCRAFSSAENRAWLANGLQEQRGIYSSPNKWIMPFWSPWNKPRSIQSDSEAVSAGQFPCLHNPSLPPLDGWSCCTWM